MLLGSWMVNFCNASRIWCGEMIEMVDACSCFAAAVGHEPPCSG